MRIDSAGNVEVMIKEENVEAIVPEEELTIEDGSWKCNVCGKIMDNWDTARNHISAHFAIPGGLTCLLCGKNFDSKVFFAIHMTSKHKKTVI